MLGSFGNLHCSICSSQSSSVDDMDCRIFAIRDEKSGEFGGPRFNAFKITMLNPVSRFLGCLIFVLAAPLVQSSRSAERFVLAVPPQPGDVVAEIWVEKLASASFEFGVGDPLAERISDAWPRYLMLWQSLLRDPGSKQLRGYFGLPLVGSRLPYRVTRPRRLPAGLPRNSVLRSGQYIRLSTPLVNIDSTATPEQTLEIANRLHDVYWVWTQLFFPLWKSAASVAGSTNGIDITAGQTPDQIASQLRGRLALPPPMNVVLLSGPTEYQQLLSGRASAAGLVQSTGYYDDQNRRSYFYIEDQPLGADPSELIRSQIHEWTHQLFREATDSDLRNIGPGEKEEFWLIEGIAGYMESVSQIRSSGNAAAQPIPGLVVVGGWDSSRLQYARRRVVADGDSIDPESMRTAGRVASQRSNDLARDYAQWIAWSHFAMNGDQPTATSSPNAVAETIISGDNMRRWLYGLLADQYEIPLRRQLTDERRQPDWNSDGLRNFLSIDDSFLMANPATRAYTDLCLAGCRVTDRGLQSIEPSANLRWLDVGGLQISDAGLRPLLSVAAEIGQLNLERTAVTADIAESIRSNSLTQLDITLTSIDDRLLSNVPSDQLTVLYATGSQLTDASIAIIAGMKNLRTVDVQATKVSDAAIDSLKSRRPDLNINPLQVRRQ